MFNSDLQTRFAQSATDAAFQMMEAGFAAGRIWQEQMLQMFSVPAPTQAKPTDPWTWAFEMMSGKHLLPAAAPAAMFSIPVAAFKPAAFSFGATAPAMNSWMPAFNSAFAKGGATSWPPSPEMMNSYVRMFWTMPAVSWSLYRMPMTAFFVSAGLPYAIAAPAANASTAALDAADAMRLQTVQAFATFANYQTAGGHASSQIGGWPQVVSARSRAVH